MAFDFPVNEFRSEAVGAAEQFRRPAHLHALNIVGGELNDCIGHRFRIPKRNHISDRWINKLADPAAIGCNHGQSRTECLNGRESQRFPSRREAEQVPCRKIKRRFIRVTDKS